MESTLFSILRYLFYLVTLDGGWAKSDQTPTYKNTVVIERAKRKTTLQQR